MQVVLLSPRGARLMDLPHLYPTVRVHEIVHPVVNYHIAQTFTVTSRLQYREFACLDRCSYEEKE